MTPDISISPITLSAEAVRNNLPSLQYDLPDSGVKFAVATPYGYKYPLSMNIQCGQRYRIAFARKHKDWPVIDRSNECKVKKDILHMWLMVDDGTFFYYGSFYRIGTLLINPRHTIESTEGIYTMTWEITDAPREVLIEKVCDRKTAFYE